MGEPVNTPAKIAVGVLAGIGALSIAAATLMALMHYWTMGGLGC